MRAYWLVPWCLRQPAGLALISVVPAGIPWVGRATALQALDIAGPTISVCSVI
jgi:hypothetical protein